MKSKIFISWSGPLGESIAAKLREFLPSAYPNCDAFFSQKDIISGELGIDRLVKELRSTQFGFILLTPDALISPWVVFESGCLFQSSLTKVFPVLCGIEQSALGKHPLGQIQCRKFDKKDLRELISTMNENSILTKYDQVQLDHWFDAAWVKFEMELVMSKLEGVAKSRNSEPKVGDQVAAAIIGQGELATMNVSDLIKILKIKGE